MGKETDATRVEVKEGLLKATAVANAPSAAEEREIAELETLIENAEKGMPVARGEVEVAVDRAVYLKERYRRFQANLITPEQEVAGLELLVRKAQSGVVVEPPRFRLLAKWCAAMAYAERKYDEGYRWEPVQDPPCKDANEQAELESASAASPAPAAQWREGYLAALEDLEEHEVKAALDWSSCKIIETLKEDLDRKTQPPRAGEWLGKPLRDGLTAGPLKLVRSEAPDSAGQWVWILKVRLHEFGFGYKYVLDGVASNIDQLTRDWLASLANLEAE